MTETVDSPPASSPKNWAKAAQPGTVQQNSVAYGVQPPMAQGHIYPDLTTGNLYGGPAPAGNPTFVPFGNRAEAGLGGFPGLNSAGGVTAIIVPPDRYWRARTSPLTGKSVALGKKQAATVPTRGKTPGVSFGT